MLRNDSKVFVVNRNITVPRSPWSSDDTTSKVQEYTNQLVVNNGEFCRLHGQFLDPFKFLDWMENNNYLFERDCRRLKVRKSESGFIDVQGNLLQISSAFHYRFFDNDVLQKWLDRVDVVDPKSPTEKAPQRAVDEVAARL
jgi:hypothetical protein